MRKRRNKVKTTAALFLFTSCRKGNHQEEFLCSPTSAKVLFFGSFFSLLFAKSRRFHEQDERWRESCFLSIFDGDGVDKGPVQGLCSSFCLVFVVFFSSLGVFFPFLFLSFLF